MKIFNKKLSRNYYYYFLLIISFLTIFNVNNTFATDKKINAWVLDNSRSYLDFSSVKNASIIEVHKFKDLSGGITKDGLVEINISLDSVATGIEIRDQRLKDYLFETKKYPNAVFTTQVNLKKVLSEIKENKVYQKKLDGYLTLKGHKVFLKLNIKIKSLSSKTVQIMSLKPIVLNIVDFKMTEGIEKLQEMAQLDSIGFNVPINFKAVFKKNEK